MPLPPAARLLLLQLGPLLVFLVVDACVTSPGWAIGAALAAVALQAGATFHRERRVDRLVLLDVALIGGLGAVSLVTRDELFFRLKPAILEAVMLPFLVGLALGGERLLGGYLRRYAAAATVTPAMLAIVRRLFLLLGGLVLVHAGLVAWAARYASRRTWAALAGPGFYALVLPLVGWALWQRWRRRRAAGAGPTAAPPRAVSGRARRRP